MNNNALVIPLIYYTIPSVWKHCFHQTLNKKFSIEVLKSIIIKKYYSAYNYIDYPNNYKVDKVNSFWVPNFLIKYNERAKIKHAISTVSPNDKLRLLKLKNTNFFFKTYYDEAKSLNYQSTENTLFAMAELLYQDYTDNLNWHSYLIIQHVKKTSEKEFEKIIEMEILESRVQKSHEKKSSELKTSELKTDTSESQSSLPKINSYDSKKIKSEVIEALLIKHFYLEHQNELNPSNSNYIKGNKKVLQFCEDLIKYETESYLKTCFDLSNCTDLKDFIPSKYTVRDNIEKIKKKYVIEKYTKKIELYFDFSDPNLISLIAHYFKIKWIVK
ncbi:hypothetical protein JCM19296_35 [Nonlabens ulvanivorans]|uniref:Uncharacterized protein n=1 Tax=Nonlabens ulvanivorans TaxID=906888 RepID=A0A081D6B1_NONUL|nr:hypothetical protein [Nonlabens ulvanivorans]GAK74457.1 hypothetical protein JCM19296_35 [Nonlabens ulvanivorans]